MLKNKLIIKLLCAVLSLVLALSMLSACTGSDDDTPSSKPQQSDSNADTDADTDADIEIEVEEPAEDTADDTDIPIIEDPSEEEPEEGQTVWDLQVYNGQAPIQTHYRGISSTVYHAFGYMKDDKTGRAYTDDMLAIELNRLQDTGIHFCRTRFDTRWIWSSSKGNWDFDTARANYFYEYCSALQERGMEVLLQLGWHFNTVLENTNVNKIAEAEYLLGNGDNINGEGNGYDYSGKDAEEIRMINAGLRYGDAYAKLLKELKSRGINNVSHLVYYTESCSFWDSTPVTERERQYGAYLLVSQHVKKQLTKLGVADWVKHMGPNQSSPDAAMMSYILERDTDIFDVWGTHSYPNAGSITDNVTYDLYEPYWDNYVQPLKDHDLFGKAEFWVDEYQPRDQTFEVGKPDTRAWCGLQGVVGAIGAAQKGISNISTWQSFDQLWTDQTNSSGEFLNGIHMCGHAPSLFMSSIPRGPYYVFGLYGKYNGYENGTIYDTNLEDWYWDAGLYINANKLADGNWTITVVNAEIDDATFTVDFEKAIGRTLYRHCVNANTVQPDAYAELAPVDKVYVNVKDRFIDTIPSGSVSIYTTIKG